MFALQQGQMFCSLCQIWSQDTPFISFVTLVTKNFAAYLRFLKWKPFLAFHFPQWGLKMLSLLASLAWLLISDIAWVTHRLNFRIFHGLKIQRFVSQSIPKDKKTLYGSAIVCDITHILLLLDLTSVVTMFRGEGGTFWLTRKGLLLNPYPNDQKFSPIWKEWATLL